MYYNVVSECMPEGGTTGHILAHSKETGLQQVQLIRGASWDRNGQLSRHVFCTHKLACRSVGVSGRVLNSLGKVRRYLEEQGMKKAFLDSVRYGWV